MATEKQIAANRQNARNSTGPRTDYGKRRSRQNAIRHGLTAKTVISVLEDRSAYNALQRAIFADYRPRSKFELELVTRLISLLWRLRRAVAIESGLLTLKTDGPREGNSADAQDKHDICVGFPTGTLTAHNRLKLQQSTSTPNSESSRTRHVAKSDVARTALAQSFLQLAGNDGRIFERLGRYEISLWRQTVQIILLLNSINCPSDKYADPNRNDFRSKHTTELRRRTLWPPFVPSN